MNARASIQLDQQYYESAYDDWLRHRSVYRRHQRMVGVFIAALGGTLLCLSALKGVPMVLLAIGAWEVLSAPFHRRKWVSARLQDRRTGGTVDLTFTNDGIEHRGPLAEGKLVWTGLKSCTETPRGIVFHPQEGIQLYVPKAAIHPSEAVTEILQLAQNAEARPATPADSQRRR